MDFLSGLKTQVSIEKTGLPEDLQWAAALMSSNEPWLTLQRNYADALAFLQDPLSEVYIIKEEKQCIGVVMIKLKGSFTGYIQTIAIAETARGKGIGEAAIGFVEERIFSESPNAFICVSSFNSGAQKLYERLGYRVVGILTDYIVRGLDEVLLRKSRGPIQDFKRQKPVNA